MRIIPDQPIQCSICGSTFALSQAAPRPPAEKGRRQKGLLCPFCTAEIKLYRKHSLAVAANAVRAHYGVYLEAEPDTSVADVLERECRHEDEVEPQLAAVASVDLHTMERYVREALARCPDDEFQRKAIDAVQRAQAAQAEGTLIPAMRPAADEARARIRAERERCLRVFEARGAGTGLS